MAKKRIKVRPGKTQSKAGFVVGIMFCLIGVFAVVPIFGPFGLIWTAMAGWITYSNYRNGFTDKPISDRVIEIEEDGTSATVKTGFFEDIADTLNETGNEEKDVESRMRKLQSLYQQELITKEEYEKKRQEILDRL